jgi:two-component system, LytTR family, sensor kinase
MKRITLSLVIALITGWAIFAFLFFSMTGKQALPFKNPMADGFVVLAIFLSWALILLLYRFLNKTISWAKHINLRFGVSVLAGVLICTLVSFGFYKGFTTYKNLDVSSIEIELFSEFLVLVLLLNVVSTIFDFATFSYHLFTYEKVRQLAWAREQKEIQFDVLKSQLSPHFLFNSLNALTYLLRDDLKKGELFIRRFADTYKYLLKNQDRKLIPLREEKNFLNAFEYLLKVRHGESFEIKWKVSEDLLDCYLPPLTLQILTENVFKHNEVQESDPILIEITYDDHFLHFSNSIHHTERRAESFNIGIENLKRRFAYFSDQAIKIESNGFFKVSLPLINTAHEKDLY